MFLCLIFVVTLFAQFCDGFVLKYGKNVDLNFDQYNTYDDFSNAINENAEQVPNQVQEQEKEQKQVQQQVPEEIQQQISEFYRRYAFKNEQQQNQKQEPQTHEFNGPKEKSKTPAFWIDAGIHAREWITIATALYYVKELLYHFSNPEGDKNITKIDWYIAPLINPDGHVYSRTTDPKWRKNRSPEPICAKNSKCCKGVDLNRNFEFFFNRDDGSSKYSCADDYEGVAAADQPETRAVQKMLSDQNINWQAAISLHSYGQLLLIPFSIQDIEEPDNLLELEEVGQQFVEAVKKASGANYTAQNSVAGINYITTGSSSDWIKHVLNIRFVYDIELRPERVEYGDWIARFQPPTDQIKPTASETWQGLKVIAYAILNETLPGEKGKTPPENEKKTDSIPLNLWKLLSDVDEYRRVQ